MSGIAGIIANDRADGDVLHRMLKSIKHRGPENTEVYLEGNVAFGLVEAGRGHSARTHDRLLYSLSNEDCSIVGTLAGKIFNLRELHKKLEKCGHELKNGGEAELLVHLYEEYGLKMFELLNGAFAACIWDGRTGTFVAARDRFGEMPLYYCQSSGTLYFASEIKGILENREVPGQISPIGLREIFVYGGPLSSNTAFSDIYAIPPGSFLLYREGKKVLRSYWQFSYPQLEDENPLTKTNPSYSNTGYSANQIGRSIGDFSKTEAKRSDSGGLRTKALGYDLDDYMHDLEHFLSAAIWHRMRGEEKIGFYLSGGVDSSLVAAMAARLSESKLETFSLCFTDGEYDEAYFQRLVAKHLGVNHHALNFSMESLPEMIDQVVWHLETPILRAGVFPMYALGDFARRYGRRTILTGLGADELFGGHHIFREAKVKDFCSRDPGSRYRKLLYRKIDGYSPGMRQSGRNQALMSIGSKAEELLNPHLSRWRAALYGCQFFSTEYQAIVENEEGGALHRALTSQLPLEFSTWSALQRAQFLEINILLPGYLLSAQGDRMAMAAGVELMHPFLDQEVVEFARTLPDQLKMLGLQEKYLLRKLAARYLPTTTFTRKKMPYRAPINPQKLLSHPAIRERLSYRRIAQTGIFDPDMTQIFLQVIERKKVYASEREVAIFLGILTAQILYEKFIANR